MLNIHPIKKRDYYLLALILFIAMMMRFGQSGIVEFYHDDAMVSSVTQEALATGTLPLRGINSSTGIPNPPTSIYVMMLPFSLSKDPNFAIYFVMGLNVVGVGLLWLIAQRYFGRLTALAAGLIYAVSPWAVLFSRKIWAQDFHSPFILLGILLGIYGFMEAGSQQEVKKGQRIAQILCLPILLFGFQIHFASWALLPVVLIIYWLGRSQIRFKAMVLSIILSVICLLPYGLGLRQTLLEDPGRISDAANRSPVTESVSISLEPIEDILFLSSGLGMEKWLAPEQQEAFLANITPPSFLWAILIVLLVAGCICVFISDSPRLGLLILVWAFVPASALIVQWTDVYVHYFIASIPALALLTGIGFAAVSDRFPFYQPHVRTGFLAVLAFILMTQVMWWRASLRYLDEVEIAYPGFTTPIHYLNQIRDVLADRDDVIVISYGNEWLLHHESVVWDTLLEGKVACVRTIRDGYAILPDHPFKVLFAPDAPASPLDRLYEKAKAKAYPTRLGAADYWIQDFESLSWIGEMNTIEPVRFENDIQLSGYELRDDGIYLFWKSPARQVGADYQYSVQVFDENGERILHEDRSFLAGRHWCEDEMIVTWIEEKIPEQGVSLAVSLYQFSKDPAQPFQNLNYVDALGNPAGQIVEIRID